MNRRREYRLGATLSYINTALSIALGLLVTPMLWRALKGTQYELYQLIGSFVGYIAVLDFGLGSAVIRYVAKYRAEGDTLGMQRFLGMVLPLYAAIGVLIAALGWVCYHNLGAIFPRMTAEELALSKRLFVLVICNVSCALLTQALPAILHGCERFVVTRGVTILRQVLRPVVLYVLMRRGTDAVQVVLLDTALNLMTIAVHALFVFGVLKVRVRFQGFDKRLLRELFGYSIFIFVGVVANMLYWQVDAFIVGRMWLSRVAITTTAGLIAQYFIDLSGALGGMLMPRAVQIVTEGGDRAALTDLMIRVGRLQWMLLGVIPVGFAVCGHNFLTLWAGEKLGSQGVDQCYTIVLMLMLALMIPLIEGTGITILQAMNRHAFRALMLLGISVLNVALTVYLVRLYGPVGAAVGTALSLLVGNAGIINWYYHRRIGLDIPRFFRQALRGTLPALLVSGAVSALTLLLPGQGWAMLAARVVLIVIIHTGCMWLMGANAEEKNLALSMLRSVTGRLQRRRNHGA
ncbi:MAG: oligosaccharide flippase family protein [Oscillospiraceae bacterium]|jgi:O-antigen/teichoic acid export membrane protein|nr:oligosaccharide flippase family protein [Oscillospiraceae bacterium]